jgi:hypothetical protein
MSPSSTSLLEGAPPKTASKPAPTISHLRTPAAAPAVAPAPPTSVKASTSPTPAARSSPIAPSVPASAPTTHADVLAMHSVYGNAAIAQAAKSGSVALAPAAAPTARVALPVPDASYATAQTLPSPSAQVAALPPTEGAAGASHVSTATHSPAALQANVAPSPPATPAATASAGYASAPALVATATGGAAAKGVPSAPATPAKTGAPTHPTAAGAGRHEKGGAEKAPTPSAHAALAPVVNAIRHRAATARKHSPAGVPVASAQAAAVLPDTERKRTAALQTVTNLDTATTKTGQIKREEFKTKLKDAIRHATPPPKSESDANDLMKNGASKASKVMKGELGSERAAAVEPLKAASADLPASSQPDVPKSDLIEEPVGAPPAPVSSAPAVPAGLPPEQLDYSSDRAPTDRAMAESGVTKEQLEKGNEPEFKQTLSSRASVEQHEASVVGRYRKSEAGVRDQAEHAAHAEIAGGLAGMQGARGAQIAKVVGQQNATKAKHALEHQRVTNTINGIKNQTLLAVESILTSMEDEAQQIFEAGLARAEQAYHDTFEDAKGGAWTWVTTWGSDWEELIENSLDKARHEYFVQVDIAIDAVANLVDAKLDAAKHKVEDGWNDVQTYVRGLDDHVRGFGEEALKSVSADFDAMRNEIDQHRDALVDKLAEQYKASYDRMSAMEEKLREENKSLWQRIYDATVGLIKKILAFKDMLLNVLARAASAIGLIIAHPIDFLGNLIDAGKLGFSNFVDHIAEHLKEGFMQWLFGAVAETGIQLPKDFDLPGILSLVMQILGLTYANIRSRAVKILGEKVVKVLETTAEIFKVLISKGPAGLWEYIKEKVGDLKTLVIEKIKSFVMEKIIMAGVTWLIGLLNPASAFFKACKAIYDIIMFFVEHGQQILDLVNAIIDSITSIAKGAIGAAADYVETSLARTIPVIIGFLASLLGVGGISDKIREIIESIRKPINEAVDWVVTKALDLAKAVGGLLGFGKKDDKKDDKSPDVPEMEVAFAMSGTQHTLSITPGSEMEMASKDKTALSAKIGKAVSNLRKKETQDPDTQKSLAAQVTALEKVEARARTEEGKTGQSKAQEKAGLARVAELLAEYAADFHVTDIGEILASEGFPIPEVDEYAKLKSGAKLPDGKIREAHHAPPVEFGVYLGHAMKQAGTDLQRHPSEDVEQIGDDLAEAGEKLSAAAASHGPELPAILVHQDTHRTEGGASRIHGSEIRAELTQKLSGGPKIGPDFAKTTKDVVSVKPGEAAFKRQLQAIGKSAMGEPRKPAVKRALKSKGSEIVERAYNAEEARSIGAVQVALSTSVVDGPKERMKKVESLRARARRIWRALLERIF